MKIQFLLFAIIIGLCFLGCETEKPEPVITTPEVIQPVDTTTSVVVTPEPIDSSVFFVADTIIEIGEKEARISFMQTRDPIRPGRKNIAGTLLVEGFDDSLNLHMASTKIEVGTGTINPYISSPDSIHFDFPGVDNFEVKYRTNQSKYNLEYIVYTNLSNGSYPVYIKTNNTFPKTTNGYVKFSGDYVYFIQGEQKILKINFDNTPYSLTNKEVLLLFEK